MEKGTLLVGEPMGLFIAQEVGLFEDVGGYYSATAGAEFNVAIGIRRLGHPVGYYTKLGSDPFGRRIVKMMNAEGISTDLIRFYDDRFTGFMLKSKAEEGDPRIFYFRRNSAASTLCPEDVRGLDLSGYRSIHMTGITPALSPSCMEATDLLIQRARREGLFSSFDPNLREQLWKDRETMRSYINGVAGRFDLFLPGINEARILVGSDVPEEIARFYLRLGCKAVIIKLGSRGAYYAAGEESGYVEGFPVEKVVDTVGAGDGFAAGVLTAHSEGLPWAECVRRGNAVGAIQVMSLGDNDGLPTRQELLDFMEGKAEWRKNHNEF